jgi:hypothetical protein
VAVLSACGREDPTVEGEYLSVQVAEIACYVLSDAFHGQRAGDLRSSLEIRDSIVLCVELEVAL